jgi:hypothetical protein
MPPPPPEPSTAAAGRQLRIARGSFYLNRELCDLYLPRIEAIAPLSRDGRVYLLPLLGTAAGGLLLKLRNARGDRVVHALEFLRSVGVDADAPERLVVVSWASDLGGLLLEGIETQPTVQKQIAK